METKDYLTNYYERYCMGDASVLSYGFIRGEIYNIIEKCMLNLIKIGIIEESTVLKNWYIANGFLPVGTRKFDHLPFASGYLERSV